MLPTLVVAHYVFLISVLSITTDRPIKYCFSLTQYIFFYVQRAQFPAVTICNMNMLRAGELPDIYIKDILEAGNLVRPQGKVRGGGVGVLQGGGGGGGESGWMNPGQCVFFFLI